MGIVKDLRRYLSVFVNNDSSNAIPVEVVNQLDLSTIEALLTQIRDSTAAIDTNTDEIETKLDTIISEVQTNGTTNHNDLLDVITELQSIDANTDNLEAQLTSIITNTSTNATEATLSAIKAITDQMTFTGNDLNVNATVSLPAGAQRPIEVVEALADGSTTAGVQSVSILFDGKNGTLDSVSVPDKYTASFAPNGNSDTVGAIDFEVPTTKGQRVVITYVKVT